MTSYIAMLYKEPDSDFGVSFPDFPGCITAGTTLEEAWRLAEEALEGSTPMDGRLHARTELAPRRTIGRYFETFSPRTRTKQRHWRLLRSFRTHSGPWPSHEGRPR